MALMRMIPGSGPWTRRLWPTAFLFALPFVLRILALLELQRGEMFRLLVVDARTYHDLAAAIATGHWSQVGPFWQPPFYPYLLASLYKLASPDPTIARIIQSLLGSISCLLVFRLGDRLFGRRAAWIGWGIAAAYGPLLFFDLQILNAGLVTFLILLALDLLTAGGRPWRILVAGLATGLAAITVATALLIIPLAALWLVLSGRSESPRDVKSARPPATRRKKGWAAAAIFLVAAVVPVAIVTADNVAHCGEVVLVSYNAGINFWIGNNPDYERTVAIRPGRAWDALDKELRLARVPTAAQSSGYWFRKSFSWIGKHPAAWVGLMLHKTRLFLRGDELFRNQEIYPLRQYSLILRILLWIRGVAFPFGLLLPLGAAGIVTLLPGFRRSSPAAILPLLLILIYSAGVIAFFPAGRYRLPIVPLLILFAAGGIARWIPVISTRRYRPLLLPAGVFLAMGVVSNTGLPAMSRSFNSDAYTDLGFSYQEKGKLDAARREYETALKIDPNNMEATNNIGTILLIQEKPEEARPYFLRILEVYPDDRKALTNLGTIYLRNREPYWAGYYYQRAQRADPTASNATEGVRLAGQMADALESEQLRSDPNGFLDLLGRFYADEPQNDFLYERLMRMLEGRGLDERALELVRIRLRIRPDDVDLRLTASRLLERLGRPAEARRVLNGAQP
jgi:tetratricopeptide (TPR) repeat protein